MSSTPEQHHNRLACQACQRKKIKCDRTFPCGQCTRSGLQCASSQRKPRARHVSKRAVDSELRNRITKLESLVDSLSGEVVSGSTVALEDGADHSPQPQDATSPALGKYIGTQFWSSLTTEVQALREALEDDQEDEAAETNATTMSSSENGPTDGAANEYDLLICPPGMVFEMPGALAEPSPFVAAALIDVFIGNVTPILSIFHVPSMRRSLIEDAPYFGLEANSAPCRAFKAAVWFAAVNTLSELDCQSRFGQKKPDMIQHYRRCVEVRLSQADLFTTTEMTTMHAFLTYLMALRTTDTSRRTWTLTATLVRIAMAMDLHLEVQGKSAFEMEMRRKLWYHVRLADVFASGDRSTPNLISGHNSTTLYPKNTNDMDYDEDSTSIPSRGTGMTDTSFATIIYEATKTTQRLNFPDPKANPDTWPQRVQIAEDFKKAIESKVLQYCDLNVPFHRMIHSTGKTLITGMLLRAVRPLQQQMPSPPRLDNPYVLQIAVDNLRQNEKFREDPTTEQWRWIIWVQWHPLSVALASLCMIRGTPLADTAWQYVERAYKHWSSQVADTSDGMLWRPIEKLYKKATAFRDAKQPTSPETAPQPRAATVTPDNMNRLSPAPIPVAAASYVHTPSTQRGAQDSRPLGSIPLDPTIMSGGNIDFSNMNLNDDDSMADMHIQHLFAAADNSNFQTMSSSMGVPGETSQEVMQPPANGYQQLQPNGGDEMDWLDWENVLNDFSEFTPPSFVTAEGIEQEATLGDMYPPGFVPPGAEWDCPLHQNLM